MRTLAALAVLAIGGSACGPQVPIVHQQNAVENSKRCFEVGGQEVRAYRVPCPDPYTYINEYVMWMQRVATEWRKNPGRRWWQLWKKRTIPVDPRSQVWPTHMLDGLRVVLVNNWIQCGDKVRGGCTSSNINGKPTILVNATTKSAISDTGHEWCHGAGFTQGIKSLQSHQYRRVLLPNAGSTYERTHRDVWIYGVCGAAGKSRPRLKRSILMNRCSGRVGLRRCKRVTRAKYCPDHGRKPPIENSGEIRSP